MQPQRAQSGSSPPSGALPSASRLPLHPDTMSGPRTTSPPWARQVPCAWGPDLRCSRTGASPGTYAPPAPSPPTRNKTSCWTSVLGLRPCPPLTHLSVSKLHKIKSLGHPDPICCLPGWIPSYPCNWFVPQSLGHPTGQLTHLQHSVVPNCSGCCRQTDR